MSRAQSPFPQTDIRARMEEDEQLSVLMAGLRGSNINASDFADEDVVMKVPPARVLHRPFAHCLSALAEPAHS